MHVLTTRKRLPLIEKSGVGLIVKDNGLILLQFKLKLSGKARSYKNLISVPSI